MFILMAKGKVYSYSYDQQQADRIMNYIRMYPNCIRRDIVKDCITNEHRLKYLAQQGLIKLPDPMPRGLRNGLKFRKQNEKQTQT
jgi:hypothetical protein